MDEHEPVVCPGCYSVDDEPCAPDCIDDEMRREAEESYDLGPSDEEPEPYVPPECMACEDTGYEAGMPGYYCTFCKKGCAVATAQMKRGVSPFDPHGEESDADKRRYEDWGADT